MTVGELIEELKRFPNEMEACYAEGFFGDPMEIFGVEGAKHTIHPVIDGKIVTTEEDVALIK